MAGIRDYATTQSTYDGPPLTLAALEKAWEQLQDMKPLHSAIRVGVGLYGSLISRAIMYGPELTDQETIEPRLFGIDVICDPTLPPNKWEWKK